MKYVYTFFIKGFLFLFVFHLFFVGLTKAQTCKEVFSFCDVDDSFFSKRSLARSYKIQPNQKLQLIHLFYGGTGYQINVCKDEELGDFEVKIIDFKNRTVLWDNSEDNYDSSISISFGATQRIIVEITPKNPENFKELSKCVGVIINYHREEELKDTTTPEDPPGM